VAVSGALAADAAHRLDEFWRGHRRWTPVQRGVRELQLVSNHPRACRHRIRCLYAGVFALARESHLCHDPILRSRLVHSAPADGLRAQGRRRAGTGSGQERRADARGDCELWRRQFCKDLSKSRLILGDRWSARSWTNLPLEAIGRALRRWL
jgi:hypothetical protein